MANEKSTQQPKGQQKVHTATRVNPSTGATESKDFTQQEWRNRNKTEGWERPEGEVEADEPAAGDSGE